MTIFGYTVRLPDIEPFMGEDRPPQFTAKKVIIIPAITKTFFKTPLKIGQELFVRLSNTCLTTIYLPSHKVSFPLQVPFDRHCLIFDPRRIKPSSHINCTLCGYVVRLPTKDPLLGALSALQSFAVEKKIMIREKIC